MKVAIIIIHEIALADERVMTRHRHSTRLSKASYEQEPRVEVHVPYMANLFGAASPVLGDVSGPDL